jgi:hypothetical protein
MSTAGFCPTCSDSSSQLVERDSPIPPAPEHPTRRRRTVLSSFAEERNPSEVPGSEKHRTPLDWKLAH